MATVLRKAFVKNLHRHHGVLFKRAKSKASGLVESGTEDGDDVELLCRDLSLKSTVRHYFYKGISNRICKHAYQSKLHSASGRSDWSLKSSQKNTTYTGSGRRGCPRRAPKYCKYGVTYVHREVGKKEETSACRMPASSLFSFSLRSRRERRTEDTITLLLKICINLHPFILVYIWHNAEQNTNYY